MVTASPVTAARLTLVEFGELCATTTSSPKSDAPAAIAMDGSVLCVTALLVSSTLGAPPCRRGGSSDDDEDYLYDDPEADEWEGYRFPDNVPGTLQITPRYRPQRRLTTACPQYSARRKPTTAKTTTTCDEEDDDDDDDDGGRTGLDARKDRRRSIRIVRDGPPRQSLPVKLWDQRLGETRDNRPGPRGKGRCFFF